MSWKSVIPLLLFSGLVSLLAFGLRNDPTVIPSPLLQQTMPAFSAVRLDDPQYEVSESDWLGRKALVNVWASWCAGCREEHELLMELREKGAVIYGLNYKDTRTDALAWLDTHGDPYQFNVYDDSGRIGIDWGVYGVPETFVINEFGMIRYKHVGVLTAEAVEQTIWPLLQTEALP